ncbi:MAG: MoaD/ThiS family protein [Desulfovibrio sp.]|jgi:molybdopterin converting factor small subunit|nr:MoaD/ThiS family protein [Desulfovibrio sp.]
MKIFVTLSTTLRNHVADYNPEQGLTLELESSASVRSLAEHLRLPHAEFKIVMLNGRHASLDDALADGDRVALFPAVGGG